MQQLLESFEILKKHFGDDARAAEIIERETRRANEWIAENTTEEPDRKPRTLGKVETPTNRPVAGAFSTTSMPEYLANSSCAAGPLLSWYQAAPAGKIRINSHRSPNPRTGLRMSQMSIHGADREKS